MFCPKCGEENLENAKRMQCSKCNSTFFIQQDSNIQNKEQIIQQSNSNIETQKLRQSRRKARQSRNKSKIQPIRQDLLKTTSRLQAAKVKKNSSHHIWILFGSALLLGALIIVATLLLVIEPKKPLKKIDPQQAKYQNLIPLNLNEIRKLPNGEIDLATVALKIAAEDLKETNDKKVNIENALRRIDKLAHRIQRKIKDRMSPQKVITTIAQQLYEKEKFITSQNPWDPSNLYLNLIFEGRQGYCLGFAQLWLALAERLKWRGKLLPIKGVYVPAHIFCRWDDKTTTINIETLHTTYDGTSAEPQKSKAARDLSNQFYEKSYFIHKTAIKNQVYLQNCHKKAVISGIYSNRANLHIDKLQYIKDLQEYEQVRQKAYTDIETALQWYPKNILALHNQVIMLLRDQRYNQAIAIGKKLIKWNPSSSNLSNLSRAYASSGDYYMASSYIEAALATKPAQQKSILSARFKKANYYYEQSKYQKLLEFCQEKSQSKTYPLFVSLKTKALIKLKRYDKAMALASLLRKYEPENKTYKLNLAYICMHVEEWEKAKKIYEKALWNQKPNKEAFYGLGYYWLNYKKQPQKALEYFTKAFKIEPWDVDTLFYIKKAQESLETKNE